MSTLYELEHDIHTQLTELQETVAQQREQEVDANEIQWSMDRFLIDWSDRLVEAEREEIARSRDRIEAAHPDAEQDTSIEQEHDRSLVVTAEAQEMESLIRERFAQFRYGMAVSMADIENGRAPSFTDILEQHAVRKSFGALVRNNQRPSDRKP